jgi:hypothetical protein
MAEINAIKDQGVDALGRDFSTMTESQQKQWKSSFDQLYDVAHQQGVKAERDFLSQNNTIEQDLSQAGGTKGADSASTDGVSAPGVSTNRIAPNIISKLNKSPVNQNSLILDNNIASAIQKQKLGVSLQKGEQLSLQKLQELNNTDLRLTDTVAQELGDVTHLNKGINLTVSRNSPEYRALLSELENVKPSPVGRAKGTNDRQIVADAFFAEGTTPTFITADKGIFNPLLQLSGIKPAKLGKPVPQAFPDGFKVEINGKTLMVIPVKGG